MENETKHHAHSGGGRRLTEADIPRSQHPPAQVRRARLERYLFPVLFLVIDYAVILLAEGEAFFVHDLIGMGASMAPYRFASSYIYFWVPLVFLMFLAQASAYQAMQPVLETMRSIFYAICAAFLTCLVIVYFTASSLLTSRLFVVLFFGSVLANVYIVRYLVLKLLKMTHLCYEPVVIVGTGKMARRVLRFFREDVGYRCDVLGVIDDGTKQQLREQYLLYGTFVEAEAIVRDSGVQTVIFAAPQLSRQELISFITKIQPYVRNIAYAPDLFGTPMAGVKPQVLFSEEVLLLALRNNLARRRNRIVKRAFDLVCTLLGGLVISPILLVLVIVVAISNHGHVIFAHKRVGKGGRFFPCYKFQTMVPDAQEKLKAYLAANPEARKEWEESFKLTNDPRVTKLGAFLRKTSLDELPQLWNVIRGDMSLVGPRPIVEAEIPRYGENFREYAMVLPGITGMWQASGRSDTTYEERVEMDTWYVRNWSIWVDLLYLCKTFKAVLFGKGAY